MYAIQIQKTHVPGRYAIGNRLVKDERVVFCLPHVFPLLYLVASSFPFLSLISSNYQYCCPAGSCTQGSIERCTAGKEVSRLAHACLHAGPAPAHCPHTDELALSSSVVPRSDGLYRCRRGLSGSGNAIDCTTAHCQLDDMPCLNGAHLLCSAMPRGAKPAPVGAMQSPLDGEKEKKSQRKTPGNLEGLRTN